MPQRLWKVILLYDGGQFCVSDFPGIEGQSQGQRLGRKKGLAGKMKRRYKDKIYTLKELAELNLARKKQAGMIIREIIFSKLGVMTFTV